MKKNLKYKVAFLVVAIKVEVTVTNLLSCTVR